MRLLMNCISQNIVKKFLYVTLSFNLFNVGYPPILYFASGSKARNLFQIFLYHHYSLYLKLYF